MHDDFIAAEAHERIARMLGEAAAHRLLSRARPAPATLPARFRRALSRTLHAIAGRGGE